LSLLVRRVSGVDLENFWKLHISMDRTKKLTLSADADTCFCFKHGMFARFYEQALHWFAFYIKPLKPMLEAVKDGEPVLYGGLPITSFEKLLGEGALQETETTEYGWRWPYAAQKLPEKMPPFDEWRQNALAEIKGKKPPNPRGRDILSELAAFDLAGHTPLQAMTAIAEWQFFLRNREGAE
jgi:hypothetical protein